MKRIIRSVLIFAVAVGVLVVPPQPAGAQDVVVKAQRQTPNEVLRSAQTVFIHSNSVYFKAESLENSLLQKQEFQDWGLVISRDPADADLVIEVGRKVFTTSFIFSVIDQKNNRVIASGRVNSIGGTVEGKISDSFIKRLRQVRTVANTQPTK